MNANLETPVICHQNDKVVDVANCMKKELTRHVLVVDDGHRPVGIISTVDMNNRVVAEDKDPKKICAKDIMSCPLETVEDSIEVEDAYGKMILAKKNILVICHKGKLKGVLTLQEALRAVSDKMGHKLRLDDVGKLVSR